MSETLYEKRKLSSFDKSYSAEVYIKNPDKYRQLEKDTLEADSLITRGGGYSYVAASFKKESLSLGMKNFLSSPKPRCQKFVEKCECQSLPLCNQLILLLLLVQLLQRDCSILT